MEAVMGSVERKRRSDALYKVFIRVPFAREPSYRDGFDNWLQIMSQQLAHTSITGDTFELDFEGMNRKREREKLYEVQTLARKLTRAVRGLHSHTSNMLWYASAGTRFSDMMSEDDDDRWESIPQGDREFWRRFWQTLATLDHTIDKAVPEAEAWIDDSTELGKRQPHIMAIVEVLRVMWKSITGDDAPTNIGERGPFANFLADAFEALELPHNPRAALASWSEYRANDKKTISSVYRVSVQQSE
jgi:hypothetical protein